MFNRYHVPAVVRSVRILELLAEHPEGCGVSTIAELTKIPKNSVFRIVTTLSDHGYLSREEESKIYRLSRKLLGLGYAAVDESSLIEKAADVLRDLRDATEETALLAVLSGHQGVVLEQMPSNQPVRVMIQIGHRFPMHSSAPGKALLAFMPEAERQEFLREYKFIKFSAKTVTGVKAFEAELATIRKTGFAMDNEEEVDGVTCVGAPVLSRRGSPVAAIWVTGPVTRLGPKQFEEVGQQVKTQALRISKRLGYEGTGSLPHQEATI